jgi:hypothetical protein
MRYPSFPLPKLLHTETPRYKMSQPHHLWFVAMIALFTLAGCGNVPTQPASPELPTPTATPQNGSTVEDTVAPEKTAAVASPTPPTNAKIIVPGAVGKDYQTAQDIWRAAGLHVAPAHDATGAHRLPVIDSNWVVLDQDPKAGTQVDEGSFVTATVKKYTDS